MPDISMCSLSTCHLAERCRRSPEFGTKPGPWQSYASFGHPSSEDCSGWWPWPKVETREEVEP